MHFFVIYLILGNFVEELLYCDIMKRLLLLVILFPSVGCAMAQTSKVLESIPVNAVRLTQSSFKHAEQMDVWQNLQNDLGAEHQCTEHGKDDHLADLYRHGVRIALTWCGQAGIPYLR